MTLIRCGRWLRTSIRSEAGPGHLLSGRLAPLSDELISHDYLRATRFGVLAILRGGVWGDANLIAFGDPGVVSGLDLGCTGILTDL